jgi:hypothetical protein
VTEPAGLAVDAFTAERLRSVRFLGLFRLIGVSIAAVLNVALPVFLPASRAFQSDVRLFACYWLLAVALFWASRRSARRRSSASTSR